MVNDESDCMRTVPVRIDSDLTLEGAQLAVTACLLDIEARSGSAPLRIDAQLRQHAVFKNAMMNKNMATTLMQKQTVAFHQANRVDGSKVKVAYISFDNWTPSKQNKGKKPTNRFKPTNWDDAYYVPESGLSPWVVRPGDDADSQEKRLEGEHWDINKRHFAEKGLVFNNSACLWVASQQKKRGQREDILRVGKIGPGVF